MVLDTQQGNQVNDFQLMFRIFCDEVRYRDPLVAEGLIEIESIMNTYMKIGSSQLTFKDVRENCALTTDEVSKKTGINKDVIENIEQDCSEIYMDVILKLCNCYCISPDHIRLQNSKL